MASLEWENLWPDPKPFTFSTMIYTTFHRLKADKRSKLPKHYLKVEECNEPSCEALIFPYGVVLFNIFSTICI